MGLPADLDYSEGAMGDAAMDLTIEELMLIEQRVTNAKKSAGAAYVLWILTGLVSGHRFYLNRPGTALLQIASYFVFIGFVWWIVDGFLIPGMIQQHNAKVRGRLVDSLRTQKEAKATTLAAS